ncbi:MULTISPECIES: cyclopropane fatty acyl phospholipid synthase [unclassified Prosthecochloris]|uniref:cyclopropane fatty acyl phospholipid synthase n=1 Tax=unclassified Prosthecochloris TaxID=2632826 RepID=UPI00223E694B|nr:MULTISPECIES: cyclopropane fatty acyl phospholipid synthase [unclassified Prosthecochloris]UZJ38539.1 cyclopropane fatty acyl phospholipid synthase [Prosthecochloris sp. SCSIO W1103]
MPETIYEKKLKSLLASAGIQINGPNPWDIRVLDSRFYKRVITESHLGIGESYMDGWWECDALDDFFYKVLRAKLDKKVSQLTRVLSNLAGVLINLQNPSRAFRVGETHYNIGNDLYEAMLDKHMLYSCGYWKGADNLDQAQENKLRLIFNKLQLEPGMKVLDIGCGWGGAARFAAEQYGVSVTGVTVSSEQVKKAEELGQNLPVDISLTDYRDIQGTYDRIYSIGMFEHVGVKNYRQFFKITSQCLKDDGLFLLHTIGSKRSSMNTDKWTHKYIFPNSMLPSAKQITTASEGLHVMEDWHAFGNDYYKTLKAWHTNFEHHWPDLKQAYDERFYRMWRYYLLSAAGSFRARNVQLWQILFSNNGITGDFYVSREAGKFIA